MISVIKIGGNIIDDAMQLEKFLSDYAQIRGKKILVHGGGKLATQLSARLGIETQMIDGRRITDAETLRIAVMTYAGWINKTIVAKLNSKNCASIGLSGADGALLYSSQRKTEAVDFGYVGNPIAETCNTRLLMQLLKKEISPVIAPITADENGQLLNTNADTMAGILAGSLASIAEVQLIFCFEKDGVLENVNDSSSIVTELNENLIREMSENGKINSGMLPKINAAVKAKKSGVQRVIIGHATRINELVIKNSNCTELVS